MNLPPYSTFPEVIGDKIVLRQIQPADIDDIVEISYYDAIQAKNGAEAIAMQDKINHDYVDGNSIHWGIADKTTNKIIGTCGYYRGLAEGAGELGCVLSAQYRGQGWMSAAMSLAIEFGKNKIGLKRIYAITSQDNVKAIQLFERLHFTKVAGLEDNEIEYEFSTPE